MTPPFYHRLYVTLRSTDPDIRHVSELVTDTLMRAFGLQDRRDVDVQTGSYVNAIAGETDDGRPFPDFGRRS